MPKLRSYLVFDFETTGLDPTTDRIIQVGLCEVHRGEVRRRSAWLVKQTVPIAPGAAEKHGITDEQIRLHGEPPTKSARVLLKALNDAPGCMGHNIHRFDIPFIRAECDRLGMKCPDTLEYVDTAALYKGWKLGQPKRQRETQAAYAERILSQRVFGLKYAIPTCLQELGIPVDQAQLHDASRDAYATHLIFERLARHL